MDLWTTYSVFSVSFHPLSLFIDYAGDFWRCVVTTFKKPLVKIAFIFMIVVCLASVNEVELNEV